jgi:uncharacterized iron-regulated membrane protein
MKLSRHAFTRFWDVHGWAGVATALVLHVMVFAGAFALFRDELSSWQERAPRTAPAQPAPLAPLVDRALGGAQPRELSLALPGHGAPYLEVHWPGGGGDWTETHVDLATGAVAPPTSQLAVLLYWLHFLYHPRASWGMYVAGLLAVALLLALVTGVLIHIKDLARQLHQFRPGKTVKVLWSDLHKVLGVMGLPFQLMIAFTGAVLGLAGVLLALLSGPALGGDQAAASAALWGGGRDARPSGRPGRALDVDRLIARAQAAVPGFQPRFLGLRHIGDAAATATVWGELPGRLFARGEVVLGAVDGRLLSESLTRAPTPGVAIGRWVVGLHYALYGGLVTRVVYALLAAATCLTILSGNWIWLTRREGRAASAGNRLLAKLTIGVGGGVVPATAALFWANRLAPASARQAAEAWTFFGVWALVALLFLARASSRGGWVGLLRASAVAFAAVPLLSSVGTDAHLFNLGRHGRAEVLGVELGLVLLGLALLVTAALVRRRGQRAAAPVARLALGGPGPVGEKA